MHVAHCNNLLTLQSGLHEVLYVSGILMVVDIVHSELFLSRYSITDTQQECTLASDIRESCDT
jgi:hypothetical protein